MDRFHGLLMSASRGFDSQGYSGMPEDPFAGKPLAAGEAGDLSRIKPVADPIHSTHILGSREFGGADQFFVRLVRALHQADQPVTAISRPDSPVANALRDDPMVSTDWRMSLSVRPATNLSAT